MAAAAISSDGATIAPSASATGHVMPPISAWATAATAAAVAMIRPIARDEILPRFAPRLRSGVKKAVV
jgi:hypothetical protein